MQPANQWKNKIKSDNRRMVWLTACILAVLVIATVAVVGSQLYRYAHQSDCQISLYDGQISDKAASTQGTIGEKTANPVVRSLATKTGGSEVKAQPGQIGLEVDDDTQVWKTETAIELFQSEYKNADGEITVKSADGRKVIAPGTEGRYTFSLKNTGDSSANYQIWVEANLNTTMTGVPIQLRVSGDDGWLLGGKNTWEQADALDGTATSRTIDAGRSAEYTIEWQWPFEQENDTADMRLADASVAQEMAYTVTIYTLTTAATGSDQPSDQNTLQHLIKAVKTGDEAPILLWMVALTLSAVVIVSLVVLKRRKNDREHAHSESQ